MGHHSTCRGSSSSPSRREFLVTAAGTAVTGGLLLRGARAQETPRAVQPGPQGERPDVRPEESARRDQSPAAGEPAATMADGPAGAASQPFSPYPGASVEGTVPDTLDLARRAELALNALTGALDPEYGYELYFQVRFCQNPAMMFHEGSGLPTNNPKFAEAQPMMRVMSGSDHNLDIQHAMLQSMLRNIHEDGLYYSPMERRPWSHEGLVAVGGAAPRPFANVYGNARFLLAMMALSQWDKDPAWEGRMKRLADGLVRIAIDKGDYAYYPVGRGVGEAFSFTPGGWTETEESTDGHFGVPMYFSGVIRALAGWYELSGERGALTLAGKLTAYLRRPSLWHASTELDGVFGPQHGHCTWHFHAHTAALRGLLAYALAIQDADLILFVRDGYEWLGQFGVARIGWFPEHLKADQHCESCCTADMVALAIRLSDAGAGDYWDDVDRYVRNQLVEQQLTRQDYLEQLVQSSPAQPVHPPRETSDRVIERNIGGFAGHGDLSLLPATWIMHCCTGNAATALYYAWESITRFHGETAVVNLLLNRASTWLDVHSHLPHEGQVTLVNRAARRVAVRIPLWVDRKEVQCGIGARRVSPIWVGNHVLFEDLQPGEELEVRFPVRDRTERFTLDGKEYAAHLRGNTVVEISPRQSGVGYPIYERSECRTEHAPLRRARRHIPAQVLKWT
jgi:hypothetical protein